MTFVESFNKYLCIRRRFELQITSYSSSTKCLVCREILRRRKAHPWVEICWVWTNFPCCSLRRRTMMDQQTQQHNRRWTRVLIKRTCVAGLLINLLHLLIFLQLPFRMFDFQEVIISRKEGCLAFSHGYGTSKWAANWNLFGCSTADQ